MTKVCAMAACFCLLAGPSAWAAKSNGPKAKFFAKYDTNHNGVIDEEEKAAIRKDYAADPNGELKRFDKNGDGKLDDDEIAAIKPPTGNGKKKSGDKAKAASGKTESGNKSDEGKADKGKAEGGKAESGKASSGKNPDTEKAEGGRS